MEKPIAMPLLLNSIPPIAKPTVKPTAKQKRGRGRPIKSAKEARKPSKVWPLLDIGQSF